LFVPGPWLASRAFHYNFTSSFLVFTALVNIHHFILDGAIWKLRDGRIASLLLNSRGHISDAAFEASGHFAARCADAGRWLVGGTAAARSLRVGFAVVLLVWGTVDQARYYLALHTDDLHDLQRAEALNSFDSSLQMRLARREIEDDQPQQAEASWKRAVQASPADPAPRQGLLQFLIDRDRYDEAFSLAEASLKLAPKDPNLLVDHGLLALRRGDANQARADWERAIAVDSEQMNAHLYLADELDREGKLQPATLHYGIYLGQVSRQSPKTRPAPDKVIAIVLRMADCQAQSSHPDVAVKSYQLAEKLAAQTGQGKLESLADVNEAALQAKAGKQTNALQLYQRALHLDSSIGDNGAEAQDWLAYGLFLDNAGFPARLAFACLVKSDSMKQPVSNSAPPDSLAATRKVMEKRLGAEAASIRRDPEPAVLEALALRH
jgi:tetratricopeptide (TPR) repeat protein